MKDLFFNIARNAVILAATGAVIAFAFPYVAVGIFAAFHLGALSLAGAQAMLWPAGVHSAFNAAIWLGSYFGIFGALTPAFTPLANKILGEPTTPAPNNLVRPLMQEKVQYPDFSEIERAPQRVPQADLIAARRMEPETIARQ